jgi:hypothetical protein
MSVESLKSLTDELAAIDAMVPASITKEKAEEWKARIVRQFELAQNLSDKPREQVDLKYLPGRLVGGMIEVIGTIARNSGSRIAQIEEEEARKNKASGRRPLSPDEMLEDVNNRFT